MLLYKFENQRLMLNIFVGGVQISLNGKINNLGKTIKQQKLKFIYAFANASE